MTRGSASFLSAGDCRRGNRGRWIDRGALLFSLFGLSLPNFWLGPLLMIVFSIQLGWTPVSGRGGLAHLFLPSLTLGLGMAAILTRILRAGLLQTIHEDYVRTARAKGLSGRTRLAQAHAAQRPAVR